MLRLPSPSLAMQDKVRALMVWDEEMLNFTIAHELAHIHNSDTVWHGIKDPAFIVSGQVTQRHWGQLVSASTS